MPAVFSKPKVDFEKISMISMMESGQSSNTIDRNTYDKIKKIFDKEENIIGNMRDCLSNGLNDDYINKRREPCGETVLYDVCMLSPSYSKVIKFLLDVGADPNIPDINGITPLRILKNSGCNESLEMLIQYGACEKTAKRFTPTSSHKIRRGHLCPCCGKLIE